MATQRSITVPAADFVKFLRLRAAASALTRRAEAIKKSFPFPEANGSNAGEWVVTDGNNAPIGKMTISARAGYVVDAGFSARVS